jgi:hypothetical protein
LIIQILIIRKNSISGYAWVGKIGFSLGPNSSKDCFLRTSNQKVLKCEKSGIE